MSAVAKAAAEMAVKQAAETAAKTAAKEAVEAAAKAAAKQAAETAAKAAAKQAAEAAAKAAASKAAKEAAQVAASKAAKEAAEVAAKKAAKEAAEKAAKTAAAGAAKAAGKETATSAATKAGKFILDHPGWVLGGLTAATATGLATKRFLSRNKQTLTIVKVVPTAAGAEITYSPPLELHTSDKVDVTGSLTTPRIDGALVPIVKVLSMTSIVVGKTIATGSAAGGTLLTHTSFDAQFADVLTDAASGAVVVAGGLVGDVAGKVASAFGLPDPSAWIAEHSLHLKIGAAAVLVLVVLIYVPKPRRRRRPLAGAGEGDNVTR